MIGYNAEDTCSCHGWAWQTQHALLAPTTIRWACIILAALGTAYIIYDLHRIAKG